ncbi:MAG: mycofactocin biosynthesis glycosyltransferase MftF [Actinobacteria bacterium]|nr:mycofactocin biosynthesis glycosyltransferase MftF [Actinomycetota bacterium]
MKVIMPSELAPSGKAAWLPPGTQLEASLELQGPDRHRALVGGDPRSLLRLSSQGAALLEGWLEGEPLEAQGRGNALARALVDRGMLKTKFAQVPSLSLAVVIPVKDRTELLEGLLAALAGLEVFVVDDGSANPEAIKKLAEAHGARVIRREVSGGPAAARNAGIKATNCELIAFIDSDVETSSESIMALLPAFHDPRLGAIAPRVEVSANIDSAAQRYDSFSSPLDLGERSGIVRAGNKLAYVPSATLVLRRSAIPEGFDEALRFGEDVDLLWRMAQASWLILYDAEVSVTHPARADWRALLRQRYDYGSSAAALAQRHPDAMVAIRLHPIVACVGGLLFFKRPKSAAVVLLATVVSVTAELRGAADQPFVEALHTVIPGTLSGIEATARTVLRSLGPALLLSAIFTKQSRRALEMLLLAGHARRALRQSETLSPGTTLAASLADDLAYASGVLRSSARAKSARALRIEIVEGWISRRRSLRSHER